MSNSDLILGVNEAAKLQAAFRRGGWTHGEIDKLASGDNLLHMRRVIRGYSEIGPVQHVINCDIQPLIPEDWTIIPNEEQLPNRTRGQFLWDSNKITLWFSEAQLKWGHTIGEVLIEELTEKIVLSACILDYLLVHDELIPEDWKEKHVYFWGTIYSDGQGDHRIRSLYWNGKKWDWRHIWVNCEFTDVRPAAVLVTEKSIQKRGD